MRCCAAKMQGQFIVLVLQFLEIRSRYFHYHKHFKTILNFKLFHF